MSRFTAWFPENIKPIRHGVYQTEWPDRINVTKLIWYSYFDGEKWGYMDVSPEKAVLEYCVHQRNRHESLAWRGLAKKP